MSGSDEDMSADANISSGSDTSYSPPSQLVPQLTVPYHSPINMDISLHGMVSMVFISTTVTHKLYFFLNFSLSKPRVQPIENCAILHNFLRNNIFLLTYCNARAHCKRFRHVVWAGFSPFILRLVIIVIPFILVTSSPDARKLLLSEI